MGRLRNFWQWLRRGKKLPHTNKRQHPVRLLVEQLEVREMLDGTPLTVVNVLHGRTAGVDLLALTGATSDDISVVHYPAHAAVAFNETTALFDVTASINYAGADSFEIQTPGADPATVAVNVTDTAPVVDDASLS